VVRLSLVAPAAALAGRPRSASGAADSRAGLRRERPGGAALKTYRKFSHANAVFRPVG